MTLGELEALLPNGLHDARLKSLAVDYEAGTASLKLELWIGNLDSEAEEAREGRADCELTVSGLCFCIVETPERDETEEGAVSGGAVSIDAGPTTPELIRKYGWKLPGVPPDCFRHWLYVSDWNAFIHLAGRDARLTPAPETFWRYYATNPSPSGRGTG
jgi:hypothetical protein